MIDKRLLAKYRQVDPKLLAQAYASLNLQGMKIAVKLEQKAKKRNEIAVAFIRWSQDLKAQR